MNLEPQWWHHPKYWFKSPVDGMEEPDLEKIVAEATRRGEMKAWEEAKMILVPHQQFAADHPYREVRKKLFKAVEAKLTSLKKV